jgi:hypothetical protein
MSVAMIEVEANFSYLSEYDFWATLDQRHWVNS